MLPITEAIASRAVGYVERHFLSHSLRLADALLAATAVEHGMPLATGNAENYRPVAGLCMRRFVP